MKLNRLILQKTLDTQGKYWTTRYSLSTRVSNYSNSTALIHSMLWNVWCLFIFYPLLLKSPLWTFKWHPCTFTKGKGKRYRIAVNGSIPWHNYGVSLTIWDHTVLPAGRYSIYLPWRDGGLSWPSWLDSAPAGSWTSDLLITSPMPNHCSTKTTYLGLHFDTDNAT